MKKIVIVLTALIMLISLSACNVAGNKDNVDATEPTVDIVAESFSQIDEKVFVVACSGVGKDANDELKDLFVSRDEIEDAATMNELLSKIQTAKVQIKPIDGLDFEFELNEYDTNLITLYTVNEDEYAMVANVALMAYSHDVALYLTEDTSNVEDGMEFVEKFERNGFICALFKVAQSENLMAAFEDKNGDVSGVIVCEDKDVINSFIDSMSVIGDNKEPIKQITPDDISKAKLEGMSAFDDSDDIPYVLWANKIDGYAVEESENGFVIKNNEKEYEINVTSPSYDTMAAELNNAMMTESLNKICFVKINNIEGFSFDTGDNAKFSFYGWTTNSNMPLVVEGAASYKELAMLLNSISVDRCETTGQAEIK